MTSIASSSSSSSAVVESHDAESLNISSIIRQRGIVKHEGHSVRCLCGEIAPMWTSWTDKHPGMRFYACGRQGKKGECGCGFFKWADDMIEGRARVVIIGLRDRQRELHTVNKKLTTENEKIISCLNEMKSEIEELRCVNEEVKFEKHKLSRKITELKQVNHALKERYEIAVRRMKMCVIMMTVVFVLVMILVFG